MINGVVSDSKSSIKNAHVINRNTKQGTFSNEDGEFKIPVALNDTLSISSVQHKINYIIITENTLQSKFIVILLIDNRYNLKEIVLDSKKLIGSLSIDAKKRKIDSNTVMIDELNTLLKGLESQNRLNQPITSQPIERGLAGKISKKVDPTKGFRGFGLSFGLGKRKNKKRLERIENNQRLYASIITIVGFDFFKDLNIPKNLITHFLEFCSIPKLKNFVEKNTYPKLKLYLAEKSSMYLKNRKS